MSRTIAVVGTVNYDRIILPDGRSTQGLGGILYNVMALAPYAKGDRVLAVGRVGTERQREVERLFRMLPNVDLSAMPWCDDGTNETVLTYRSNDHREEALIERVPPLDAKCVDAVADSDFAVVNMISGKELTPKLLERLASKLKGPLLLDIQSLPLTFGKGAERGHRNVPQWRKWAAPASIIKGNEAELRWAMGESDEENAASIRDLLADLLASGPTCAIMTRGQDGFAMAWKKGRGRRYLEAPAAQPPGGGLDDPTGCGDVFTSGYVLGLLRGEAPPEAALLASAHAASACTMRGLMPMQDLPDPAEVRSAAYPTPPKDEKL